MLCDHSAVHTDNSSFPVEFPSSANVSPRAKGSTSGRVPHDVSWQTVRGWPPGDERSIEHGAPRNGAGLQLTSRSASSDNIPLELCHSESDASEDSVSSSCHCVATIQDLHRNAEYALCVEYGATFLESIQPGELSPVDACIVLQCLTTAFTQLSEIERAKACAQLWIETIELSGRQCLSLVERQRWKLRHLIAQAELCKANGEREESIQAYVLGWRCQANLYGPESIKCLATYVHIAELKVQLVHDKEAMAMLVHAETILGTSENDICLWMRIRRLMSAVKERQRQWQSARVMLRDTIDTVEKYCSTRSIPIGGDGGGDDAPVQVNISSSRRVVFGGISSVEPTFTSTRQLKSMWADLSLTYMRLCEVELQVGQEELSSHASSASSRDSIDVCPPRNVTLQAIGYFAKGMRVLQMCLPPMHFGVIRAKLRLAQLYSSLKPSEASYLSGTSSANTSASLSTVSSNHSGRTVLPSDRSYFHCALSSASCNVSTRNDRSSASVLSCYAPNDRSAAVRFAKEMVLELLDELNQSEVRGGRHVHAMTEVYEALGDLERRLGEHKAAATAYNKAKAAAGQLFAPDHERCALLQYKLAEELLVVGHSEDAYHLLRELLEWCNMCPAGRMPPVPAVILLHSLGSAMRLAERFDKAEEYFTQALSDPAIDFATKAKILGNMAAMFITMGDLDRSLHFNQQALTVRLAFLGEKHPDVAASFGNIAALYQSKGNPKRALFYADKCMDTLATSEPGAPASHKQQKGEADCSLYFGKGSKVVLPPPMAEFMKHPFYVKAAAIKAWATRVLKKEYQVKVDKSKGGI